MRRPGSLDCISCVPSCALITKDLRTLCSIFAHRWQTTRPLFEVFGLSTDLFSLRCGENTEVSRCAGTPTARHQVAPQSFDRQHTCSQNGHILATCTAYS